MTKNANHFGIDENNETDNSAEIVSAELEKVLEVIAACKKNFGEQNLFYGNCGAFAIALAKWVEKSMPLKSGIVAIGLVYPGDKQPLEIQDVRGRDFNHVFAHFQDGEEWALFDGSGFVTESALDGWHKQTWHDIGPGNDMEKWLSENGEAPLGVGLAFGDLSDASIGAVLEGTDHSSDWVEYYKFLCGSKFSFQSDDASAKTSIEEKRHSTWRTP